ncbi:MAG: chromosomal replication initiator protein DnaA [Chthoniobacterales bacterium]
MTSDLQTLWRPISTAIQQRVSPDTYERWFKDIQLESVDDKILTIRVPNPIHQFFIESNFLAAVQSAVMESMGASPELRFIASHAAPVDAPVDHADGAPVASKTTRSRQTAANSTQGLNSRNTFDTFVVGPNNQFAHAASLAVAQAPARTYNPLFIYGGSGLGKTHLLQAIGHGVAGGKKDMKVVYLSSEQFTNEFIDAIQHGTLFKFRKRYRNADILMIDDIQFFGGKERSQEEFFHTFNALHDGHKQIVLTSDRPASEIEKLEQRLVSRFEWGMTAELQPPDMETRIAILQKKAAAMSIETEQWIIEFLADKIRNNVRRLEGALMRVASYRSLSNRPMTTEVIENLLRDILQEQAKRVVTIDQIQRKVAEHFDVRLADMTSKRRPANIAFPRQVAMYFSRELTSSSLSDIGDAFGGKDHGTVIHACKLVKKRMGENETTRQIIRLLDGQLQR